MNFTVTNGWWRSLYKRMHLTQRLVTTSRPVITKAAWSEVKARFQHDILCAAVENSLPDELVTNVDQILSKFIPTDNVAMAEKGSRHVSRKVAVTNEGLLLL